MDWFLYDRDLRHKRVKLLSALVFQRGPCENIFGILCQRLDLCYIVLFCLNKNFLKFYRCLCE